LRKDYIAVIGLGNIAARHRKNLKQIFPEARILAIATRMYIPSIVPDYCDEILESLDELLSRRIRFVVIASPAPFHIAHALPFIEAGVPVLIEKPVAASVQDAKRLLKKCLDFDTPVAIGYCLRYLPSGLVLKKMLEEQKIGPLLNVSAEAGQFLPDWRPGKNYRETVSANAHLGGGALLELSHEIDYCFWLLGELSLHSAILRSSKTLSLEVEDSVDLLATVNGAAVVSVHLDFLQSAPYRRCRFVGEAGALEWDLITNTLSLRAKENFKIIYQDPLWQSNSLYIEMIRDFNNLIEGKQNQCVSVEEAIQTLSFAETVKKNGSFIGTDKS